MLKIYLVDKRLENAKSIIKIGKEGRNKIKEIIAGVAEW
jgi:hypothetical protein